MKVDFTKADITRPEDLEDVERLWKGYFEENKASFSPYKEKLMQIQTIVGFGRGLWAGVHDYFYVIYHTSTEKFYWFLKDMDSDADVYFYEINPSDELFDLLGQYAVHEYFDLYDRLIGYNTLYNLSKGNLAGVSEETVKRHRPATIKDLFGEDTEKLRFMLMHFNPASAMSYYPHREYDRKILAPIQQECLQQQAALYNEGSFQVFEKNHTLYITLGADTFQLIKTEKEND